MMDAVKAAPTVHVYLSPGLDNARFITVLAELGLAGEPLGDPGSVISPAVIVLAPGEAAPEGFESSILRPPADASPAALRELLRVARREAVLHRQFRELNQIGIKLSAERDIEKLQQFILTTLRQLTNADGASLWEKEKTVGDDGQLKLALRASQNASIDQNTYQAFKVPVDEKSVVGYTVTVGRSQIYDDAYNPPPGKPQGGKGFDAQYGYRTKSMLTVPMRDHRNEVVGAVQLINAKRSLETKLTVTNVPDEVVSFRPEDLEMIESIASQAAVAIDNKNLLDSVQTLLELNQAAFDGFVKASVAAIELRDPATRGHSQNVEKLTTGLALAVTDIAVGKYKDVRLNEDQLKELHYASLLHDFGKVGVRERILIKARKLFPYQLEWIQSRFESIERSVQVKYATEKLDAMRRGEASPAVLADIDRRLEEELAQLANWVQGIVAANEPSVLPEDKASILEVLPNQTYLDMAGVEHPMLDPQEFRFLSIRKGTLDDEERREIESHVTHSWEFLSEIKWPPLMRNIPAIAYGHHEKLDGSGYPRGLRGDDIPIQVRMMTISDIYDALTAHDRQYKPAVPVTKALDILTSEAGEGKLDPDLLDIFITKRVYEVTAEK
jgi:HD-GYP domain-containing protein (c-di-GMP phosphodiesterase class II)